MELHAADPMENYKLKQRLKAMQIEVASVSAQNTRLSDENIELRQEINQKTKDYNITLGIKAEIQLQLFKLESERDDLNEALQRLKSKYYKLYDGHKCRVMKNENSFSDNRLGQLQESQRNLPIKRDATEKTHENLQLKLDELFDVITGLEFEHDYMDFLELENSQLRSDNKNLQYEIIQLKSKSETD